MKPTLGILSLFALVSLVLSAPASAQIGQTGAKVVLHAQPHNTKGIVCSGLDPNLPCSDFTTTWPLHRAPMSTWWWDRPTRFWESAG